MNIGIDARGLWKEKAGIGTYIENVIRELNLSDNKNKYILYSTKEIVLNFELNKNFEIKQNIKGHGSFWFYFKLPKVLKSDNIDVFWGTQHLLPKRNKYTKDIKFVLTIHDLAIKKLKTVGSLKNTMIQKIFVRKSLSNADKIIAVSEATKKDIMELYKINAEKINVIYEGTNLNSQYNLNESEEKEIQEKFKIKDIPYILFVSTIEPRKNVETLIRAFTYVKNKEKSNLKLIIAGRLGWKYQKVLKLYENSEYKEDIVMSGYISKEEKQFLYKNAKCFVYPSLYEGFGLPILEALLNECIVITSNISSLPEVGGDVAFYYNDVLDYEELGDKIIDVINLNENEKMKKIKEGQKQASKFTWEKCVKNFLEIVNDEK